MAKVQLKVITQIKTLGDALGMIWPQVVSSQKGYFFILFYFIYFFFFFFFFGGGGFSHIAMVTTIMIVTYIWNFSIKYYLVHILAKIIGLL